MGLSKKYPEPFRREQRNGAIYYFTYTDRSHQRRNVSTGETTKERARDFIRDFMDKQRARTSAATFREYSAPYFLWEEGKDPLCPHAARLRAEGKVIGRQHCLASRRLLNRWVFTDPLFPELKMNEIRRADLVDLRSRLIERSGGKSNSAGKAIEAVKVVLSEASFREDIDVNPGSRVSKPKTAGKARAAFTIAEVRAILRERPGRMGEDARIGAAFYTLFLLGLRCGELRALRWRHLDLEKGTGRIEEAVKGELRAHRRRHLDLEKGTGKIEEAEKGKLGVELGKPKWDKVRKVAIAPVLKVELEAWRKLSPHTEPGDFIFGDEKGTPLSQQVIKDSFASMLAAATSAEPGEEPLVVQAGRWLTPHSTRHSLNSALLSSGASPLSVAEFMGWSSEIGRSLSAVQVGYTHLELIDLKKVADLIDEIFADKEDKSARALHLA